jgi:hypothetical protein
MKNTTKRNTVKRFAALLSVAVCLSSQAAFAADNTTVIKSGNTIVNDGGYIGTVVKGGSSTNVVTNTGDGNSTVLTYEDNLYNILGTIGTYVDTSKRVNVVTSTGNGNLTYADGSKNAYNIGGVIGQYVDVSTEYNDILNR